MPPSRLQRIAQFYLGRARSVSNMGCIAFLLCITLLVAMFLVSRLESRLKRSAPPVHCVTGALGFIGHHFIRELQRVVPVVGIDKVTGDPIQLARRSILLNAGVPLYNLNVTDQLALGYLWKHLQVEVVIDFTQHEHYGSDSYNTALMDSLLMAGVHAQLKKLYFASPNRFYMSSSRSGERLLALKRKILPFSVSEFRFSTVYGEYGRRDMPYFRYTGKLLDKKVIPLLTGTKGLQDYVDVGSLVRTLRAVVVGEEDRPVWDVCSGRDPVSNLELIAMLSNITASTPLFYETEGPGLPPYETEYVKPRFPLLVQNSLPLMEGMEKFVRWYKAEGFQYKQIPRKAPEL